jgi:hypothetical protein
MHPRAEWLLHGANQHQLIEIDVQTNGTHVARASTSDQNNLRVNVLKLTNVMRVVPINPHKQEVPTLDINDD